ncbi:thiamine pyrophosphate-dependent enzyme [Sphingopyxis panaciterrae]
MAERSFAKEVEKLRLAEGDVFAGEGILAVTKALLQSGISYVGGYQGSPISHLLDVLADGQEIMAELGVHFEASASEASAAAMLAASVNYPLRGAVAWKSVVGTNVASDALSNLASGGVKGGALIIVGEDYGEGSSIMQERTHAFAMKSQMWLLDPRPNLPSIVDMVEKGFELSEASSTPVMLELRVRSCHLYGRFTAKDNVRPVFGLHDAMAKPQRDTARIVLPPANLEHEREKIAERWPAAVRFIKENRLNEFMGGHKGDIGIIVQGGMYNNLIRALELVGLADSFGETEVPIYVLNVTYPLVDREVMGFCADKKAVFVVEEGQPEFIEHSLNTILRRSNLDTRLIGKEALPQAGEYSSPVIRDGLEQFLRAHAPHLLGGAPSAGRIARSNQPDLADVVPARPAGFCTGCPERPVFTAMKLAEKELGEFHVSGDIGCHIFSILPPFHIGNTTMGYGLGMAGASAFQTPEARRTISVMGDGGFWHNGLTSGVGNAVFNRHDGVTILIDNGYAAATGGQDLLSSRAVNKHRTTQHPMEKAIRGMGADWVKTVRSYDVGGMKAALTDAMQTDYKGPKIIIAESECMLNKQRRVKPIVAKAVADGKRIVKERFGVDADTCTGDHSCIRLSGCPTLTVAENPDPLRDDPIAHVLNDCVGCGHCGETAHAAVLCPSFYRADMIYNPSRRDRVRQWLRDRLIGAIQRRKTRRLNRLAA